MLKDQSRLRLVAWACVLVLLCAAASPLGAGVPPAILGPSAALPGEPVAIRLPRVVAETSGPDVVVPRAVPARAPPLA